MKKLIYLLFIIIGTLFIVVSTFCFSYLIPKQDIKIAEIESELDKLRFAQNTWNQQQMLAHSDFNLGKILVGLGPLTTQYQQDIVSGIIDIIKDSMIIGYMTKYGEEIDKQKINELYPISDKPTRADIDELHTESDKLMDEPTFYSQRKEELGKQKVLKNTILRWSIFFQVIGLILIGTINFIKLTKEKD